MKKTVISITLLLPLLATAQTVNMGELSVRPGTEVSTYFDFHNQESGRVLNDGHIYFYNDYNNEGIFGYTLDTSTGYVIFEGKQAGVQQISGSAKIAIDIKEKSTGKLLGTYTTDTFSDGSSAKNKWSNVQLYFKVPPVEDIHCTIDDVYLEIRNDLEKSSGSRFYIANIGLTSLGSQCFMPADPLDIECPTKPLIITKPMLINQAKK